jgi:hypothetical protein
MLGMADDKTTRNLLSFYIEGRRDPLEGPGLDLEPLGKRVIAGESVRVVAQEAADDLAKVATRDGSEKRWCGGRLVKQAIAALGVDPHEAWLANLRGQTDEFAVELEGEILTWCDDALDDVADDASDD